MNMIRTKTKNTKYNKLLFRYIADAFVMGYQFDPKTGNVIGIKGKPVVLIEGGPEKAFRYFSYKPHGRRPTRFIPVHTAIAFITFGKKALNRNYKVSHKNGNTADNRASNLKLVKYNRTVYDGKKVDHFQKRLAKSMVRPFLRKAALRIAKEIPRQKEKLVIKMLEDHTPTEVAESYELSVSTVRRIDGGTFFRWEAKYF